MLSETIGRFEKIVFPYKFSMAFEFVRIGFAFSGAFVLMSHVFGDIQTCLGMLGS